MRYLVLSCCLVGALGYGCGSANRLVDYADALKECDAREAKLGRGKCIDVANCPSDLQVCLELAANSNATVLLPARKTIRANRPLFVYGKASIEGQDRDTSVIELTGCFRDFKKDDHRFRSDCPSNAPVTCGDFADYQRFWINLGHEGELGQGDGKETLCDDPSMGGCSQSRWLGHLKNLTLRLTKDAEPNLDSIIYLHHAQDFTIEKIVVNQLVAVGANTIGHAQNQTRWTSFPPSPSPLRLDERRDQIIGGRIANNFFLAASTGIEFDVMPDTVAHGLSLDPTTNKWSYAPNPKEREELCKDWVDRYSECKAQVWFPAKFCPPAPEQDHTGCENASSAQSVWTIDDCKLRHNLNSAGVNVTHFSGGCDGEGQALGGTPCTVCIGGDNKNGVCIDDSDCPQSTCGGVCASDPTKPCSDWKDCPQQDCGGCGPGGECRPLWNIENNCIDGIGDAAISMKGSRGGAVQGNKVRGVRSNINTTSLAGFGSREIVFKGNYIQRIRGELDEQWGGLADFFVARPESGYGVSEEIDFLCNFGYLPRKLGSRPSAPHARGRFLTVAAVDGLRIERNVFVDDTEEEGGECVRIEAEKCGASCTMDTDCNLPCGNRFYLVRCHNGECVKPGLIKSCAPLQYDCDTHQECEKACGAPAAYPAFCSKERRCANSEPLTCRPDLHDCGCATHAECPGEHCLRRAAIELSAIAPVGSWPGPHARCLGRCTANDIFEPCNSSSICPSGTCQHRETCHDVFNACQTSLTLPAVTGCPQQALGSVDDECDAWQCKGPLGGSGEPSVSVERNLLTGKGIRCRDPLVTKIATQISPPVTQKSDWIAPGDSLQKQLSTLAWCSYQPTKACTQNAQCDFGSCVIPTGASAGHCKDAPTRPCTTSNPTCLGTCNSLMPSEQLEILASIDVVGNVLGCGDPNDDTCPDPDDPMCPDPGDPITMTANMVVPERSVGEAMASWKATCQPDVLVTTPGTCTSLLPCGASAPRCDGECPADRHCFFSGASDCECIAGLPPPEDGEDIVTPY